MRALGARLKEQAPFYEVYADRVCQEQLSALGQRLAALVQAEERMRLEPSKLSEIHPGFPHSPPMFVVKS